MRAHLVVTIISPDRPGIVDVVSQTVASHGANWESSRMVRLGGRFAGVLLASVDPARAEKLEAALAALQADGLRLIIERSDISADTDGRRLAIELVGQDSPGIVQDISAALASRGVNVEELHTECSDAPMAGGQLFTLRALLRCKPGLNIDELRASLEGVAHDLMVDISLAED